ncbi:hypothetical protein PCANC_13511 [Puccinia coronata f. sp. avenae]|uniref:Uncharacterized protein n=1 Tax=Puccinia coronata f. sp. avenae TaxID=200324 RepID=A0A2N5V4N8_9BASI|nr:hypothetical protein PCASD_21534 [Puccinia coronata f. sp. avenae]PLW44945.1 hypothetical protein PCANC_13511 [Puccinia coronata f. sp. avenae]
MAVGSVAFSAPEGSYFFVMHLNRQHAGSAAGTTTVSATHGMGSNNNNNNNNCNSVELHHSKQPFNSTASTISASSSINSNIVPLVSSQIHPTSSSSLSQNQNISTTTTSSSSSSSQLVPASSSSTTTSSTPAVMPIVQVPAVPGVPANADVSQNLIAPPAYPCSLATVIINFPPVPPPNPFPHPGFLTAATKYARPTKDTPPDLANNDLNNNNNNNNNNNEQTDSNSSSADDPASLSPNASVPTSTNTNNTSSTTDKNSSLPPPRSVTSPIKNRALNFSSTLSSLSNASRNGGHSLSSYNTSSQSTLNSLSSRPRAAFKGSTSTFIKSSDGLPIPQSVIRTFYGTSADSSSSFSSSSSSSPSLAGREEGEERTFGFYTWNKSLTFVQLSPPRPSGETIARLTFAACPTHVCVNPYTASASTLDVVIGFATGDLMYFDPFCARYTRLNKSGSISSSPVTRIAWLAPSSSSLARRDHNSIAAQFVSSHMDGTMICWDKDRDDCPAFVQEPWPNHPHPYPPPTPFIRSTPHPSTAIHPQHQTTNHPNPTSPSLSHNDPRGHDIIISSLPHALLPSEKRNRLNPVYHWKVSKKAITDFAFSPDAKFCAIVSEDGCLRIIDTSSEKLMDTYLSYFGALLCVCWSSDGRFVFTGGQDDLVTAYSPVEQRVIARCQAHGSFVTGLSFDPWFSDDRSCRFASVSEDCKLIFWDLSGASLAKPRLHQILSSHGAPPLAHAPTARHSMLSTSSPSPAPHLNHHQHHHHHQQQQQQQQHHHHPNYHPAPASASSAAPSGHKSGGDVLDHTLTPHDHHDYTFGIELLKPRDVHPAPGRNEVAILQPVMVKEIGVDPLSAVHYHRGLIVVASRSGQISVFGRPTPPPAPPLLHHTTHNSHYYHQHHLGE